MIEGLDSTSSLIGTESIEMLSNKRDSDSIESDFKFNSNSSKSTGSHSSWNELRRTTSSSCKVILLITSITYFVVVGIILYFIVTFLVLRSKALQTSTFDNPLIPNTFSPESLVFQSNLTSNSSTIESFQNELNFRLLSIGLPISTLECSFNSTAKAHYSNLIKNSTTSNSKTLIALNLYNNEIVFPTLARTILSTINYLGVDNVHISIFENGSEDKSALALGHFSSILSSLKVEHTILSDSRTTDWSRVDRIQQLAVYRNKVLEPLHFSSRNNTTKWETVLFINDVFVCETDLLELLWQRREQKAHAACAMDWRETSSWLGFLGFKSIKFYDNWVSCSSDTKPSNRLLKKDRRQGENFPLSRINFFSYFFFLQVSRTIEGNMFRSRFDIIGETRNGINELFDQPGSEVSRERFLAGLPLPVYSCWNGMVALDATPFIEPDSQTGKVVEFRSALNQPNQCAASECKTMARDFWQRGFNRWMIVPSVHVTYNQEVYNHPLLKSLSLRKFTSTLGLSEWIDWDLIKAPMSVICYSWVRGLHLDLSYSREAAF